MLKDTSIYTQAVHAGERGPRPGFTPVSTPIHPSVGYLYDDMQDLDGVFGGERAGYVYPRYGGPIVSAFERAVATLEGAEDAVAFASGGANLGLQEVWLALRGLKTLPLRMCQHCKHCL